jgi:hypothetical protein
MKKGAAMDNPTTSRRPRKAIKEAKPDPRQSRWSEGAPAWKKKYGDDSGWSGSFASIEENRFGLPADVVDNLRRENIVLQWHVESVLGQPQDQALAAAAKNGWQAVGDGELPGVNVTKQGGLILMARPASIHERALKEEDRAAGGAVTRLKQKAGEGALPMTGADHPSARRYNRHIKSYEKLEIPADRD